MGLKDLIHSKRKELGLSQEQLAEELNVARQTISKWETGETLPDLDSLKKTCHCIKFLNR